MIIAVLFNADAPSFDGWYGHAIQSKILNTGILQSANRHMKIGCGDVLLWHGQANPEEYIELAENAFFRNDDKWIMSEKVRDSYRKGTIYTWVIQNATARIADQLDRELKNYSPYLGIVTVDISYGPHITLYRTLIGETYRIIGSACSIFYSMGEPDEVDPYQIEALKQSGFETVDLEDNGARETIFDNFDTRDHYEQINSFIKLTSDFFSEGENAAYELSMVLNDLNPRLFNAIGAAIRAMKNYKNEEDIAHIALSGRRYLEQLADVLFEPREELYNDRKVGKSQYRNRIWAYIEDSIRDKRDSPENITKLGKEVDRLIDLFNEAIHGDRSAQHVMKGFIDLALLTAALLSLQPIYKKDPYYAYQKNIFEFVDSVLKRDE